MTLESAFKQRQFFRHDLGNPISSKVKVLNHPNNVLNPVPTYIDEVLIVNLGPGGLSFVSNIEFSAIGRETLLQFEFELNKKRYILLSSVCWVQNLTVGDYSFKYGVEFILEEKVRRDLIQDVNYIIIRNRKR